MIVVPAGSFIMGSPATEPGHRSSEEPQHRVTIAKPFAVSKFEVTFEEWDACVADRSCYSPKDEGWGHGRLPVINVDYTDARRYVYWLREKLGVKALYRFLSEAEYEYATRAGTQTAYPWGNEIGNGNANCKFCGSRWDDKQTAPVGSFAPNQFGLYDMLGNVVELTEDCFHFDYNGAPTDGSAWTSQNDLACYRAVRGGSWATAPYGDYGLRSASRPGWATTSSEIGFRVAKTLEP
jgi:formylglycine-generating enzyme required for sulfatase activity